MHKKLMAVAVAGALAAPLAAQAQSTVQIYGVAEWEYGYQDQGTGRPKVDYNEVTGSYLGFKGEERIGGGMSAWFQCETTMDIRAFDQTGLCSRNSALGFKGGFGNVWGGRWHTPFSRIYSIGSVGVEETGNLGFSRIMGATGSTSISEQGTGDAGGTNRAQFRRRETCLTTYETPNMGGFMVGFAFSCGNAASDLAGGATSAGTNKKPRLWSTAGTYRQGPLGLGIGYEKHLNVGTFNGAGPELDDRAWGLTGRYTFGPVLLGMTYMDRKWETPTGHVKARTWTIGGEWTIAGPHALHFAYGDTGDAKGNSLTGIAGNGGVMAPGSDTGYKAMTLAYQYSFSKRTTAKIGWTRYDNDTNSNVVRPYNAAALLGPTGTAAGNTGQALDAFSLVIKHRF